MNFKLTMTLVIVLTLLLCLVLLIPTGKTPEKNLNLGTPLLSPQPKEIRSITLSKNGNEQLAFEKTGDDWRLTFPVKAAASTQEVASAAELLRTTTYKEKTEPGSSDSVTSETTGTATPKYQLQFTDDAGKNYTLNLGKTTITGIYATLDGSKTIYLLDGNPLDQFDREPSEFRDKNIKTVDADRITGLTVTHGDKHVSLEKADGKWTIDAPISARGNEDAASQIVDSMKSIQATGFADISKDLAGLTSPVVSVTADIAPPPPPATKPGAASQPAEKPTQVTLNLGYYQDLTTKKDVYACLAGSDDVFTISGDVFNRLNKDLKDLRDPAITPLDTTAATQVTLQAADASKNIALLKSGDQWSLVYPTYRLPAGATEVAQFLLDIRSLRAIKFVDNAGDLKSIGLDPPENKVSITLPGHSQQEVILIGKPETADAVTPVMRQGEPTVYLVQTAEAAKVLPSVLNLRDKNVERLVADEIRTIEIAGVAATSGGVKLERAGAAWKETPLKSGGTAGVADDSAVTSLLSDFTPLTAQKYISTTADAGAVPAVTVTITGFETPPATAPATNPATAPAAPTPIGPMPQKSYMHTLRLFKDKTGQWSATWDGSPDPWLFQPTDDLIKHVTQATYAAPTTTQASSQPATLPAGVVPKELFPK